MVARVVWGLAARPAETQSTHAHRRAAGRAAAVVCRQAGEVAYSLTLGTRHLLENAEYRLRCCAGADVFHRSSRAKPRHPCAVGAVGEMAPTVMKNRASEHRRMRSRNGLGWVSLAALFKKARRLR